LREIVTRRGVKLNYDASASVAVNSVLILPCIDRGSIYLALCVQLKNQLAGATSSQ